MSLLMRCKGACTAAWWPGHAPPLAARVSGYDNNMACSVGLSCCIPGIVAASACSKCHCYRFHIPVRMVHAWDKHAAYHEQCRWPMRMQEHHRPADHFLHRVPSRKSPLDACAQYSNRWPELMQVDSRFSSMQLILSPENLVIGP